MWKGPSQFHFWQRCILPRALVSVTTVIIPLAFVPLQLMIETAMTLIILIMLWN